MQKFATGRDYKWPVSYASRRIQAIQLAASLSDRKQDRNCNPDRLFTKNGEYDVDASLGKTKSKSAAY